MAAWGCALAAGLVEMSARISALDHLAARAAQAREHALALAEIELHAFGPVLDALRAAERDEARVDAALSYAAESPLALARVAAELAQLAEQVAERGKRSVQADALVGADLARAACRASARLVTVNLEARPDDPRVAEAQWLTAAAASSETSRSS